MSGKDSKKDGIKAVKEEAAFFPVNRVKLREGTPFARFQKDMNEYLLSLDADSLLYNFREAAGLSVKDAAPMTGWDAPECKLKGHTTGHVLSALGLSYAATGDGRYKKKADYMVAELMKVKDAFSRSGKTAPGFFSAYDEEQFDLLEQLVEYPQIWAPYYTLEKIMSGLYDVTVYTGNRDALKLLRGLADWVQERLQKVSTEQREKMWSMYIAGEFGGMIAVLAKLSVLCKDRKYIDTAELFYNEKLFGPLSRGEDVLSGMHANQHIPQVTGAMELYRATGEEKYLSLSEFFFETVTGHHIYAFGGTGEEEKFTDPDRMCDHLGPKTAESCATYNMTRLAALLYQYSLDTSVMDYYENALYNHLLPSADKAPSGGTTYFMPTGPGNVREFDLSENSCCHGTGMESRYRFMEHIFSEDEENYYINLLVDATLDGLFEVTTKETDTSFKVTVKALSNLKKNVMVRVPAWGVSGAKDAHGARFASGSLQGGKAPVGVLTPMQALYQNNLNKGEELSFSFPAKLRLVKNADKRFVSYAKGPNLMASLSDAEEFLPTEEAKKNLVPFMKVDREKYHLYFKSASAEAEKEPEKEATN